MPFLSLYNPTLFPCFIQPYKLFSHRNPALLQPNFPFAVLFNCTISYANFSSLTVDSHTNFPTQNPTRSLSSSDYKPSLSCPYSKQTFFTLTNLPLPCYYFPLLSPTFPSPTLPLPAFPLAFMLFQIPAILCLLPSSSLIPCSTLLPFCSFLLLFLSNFVSSSPLFLSLSFSVFPFPYF